MYIQTTPHPKTKKKPCNGYFCSMTSEIVSILVRKPREKKLYGYTKL